MKELYYYYRDKDRRPLVTVCLLVNGDEMARGVAICSPLDIPCKRTGRHIARGRAVKALERFAFWEKVARTEAVMVRARVNASLYHFRYKSEYQPCLSAFEEQLLEKQDKAA